MPDEIKPRIVYVLTRTNKADDDDSDIYVGSTSQPLEQRLAGHKYDTKNFMERGYSKNNRLYARMNEIGLDNFKILPLLSRTCDIKTICEVEKKWVRILKADLNSYLSVREEETRKEYEAAYHENNRDLVRQRVLKIAK